jgi:hypothetical protein
MLKLSLKQLTELLKHLEKNQSIIFTSIQFSIQK